MAKHGNSRTVFVFPRSPFYSVSLAALTYVPSERIIKLSQPNNKFISGSMAQFNDKSTNSRSKFDNKSANSQFESKSFIFPRSPFTSVSQASLSYEPSERIVRLSTPKKRKENLIREDFTNRESDPTNSCVFNKAALRATSSERIESLAQPRLLCKGYTFSYPSVRPVSSGAKNAVASDRVQTLAIPKNKTKA